MTPQAWFSENMTMPIGNKQGHEFAVIGLGAFGSSLARRLEALGHPVFGIDQNAQRVQDLADELADVVVMDATNDDALREVDITAFHTVIVAVSGDFAANALITSSLKSMGIPRVICQASEQRHRDILLRVGADQVIMPNEESGARLGEMLITAGILGYMALGNDHGIFEINVTQRHVGQTVDTCERQKISVLLVQRGEELMIAPSLSTVLTAGDVLYVVGKRSAVNHWLESK